MQNFCRACAIRRPRIGAAASRKQSSAGIVRPNLNPTTSTPQTSTPFWRNSKSANASRTDDDLQTRHAAKLADLNTRIGEIDGKIAELETRRAGHALDAAEGNKNAIKAIASIDSEFDQLRRECSTLKSATEQLKQLMAAEQQAALDKVEQERQREARTLAGDVATYNSELDAALIVLRETLERRYAALQKLSALRVVDPMYINKMLGRDALTRAMQAHGIARYCALMTGAPTSACAMGAANKLLAGFGGGYTELPQGGADE